MEGSHKRWALLNIKQNMVHFSATSRTDGHQVTLGLQIQVWCPWLSF
jgi:hypothetical protein